jgi:hypothetical protein
MRKLLKYHNFINEAFLSKDKEKAIDLILQYIKRKSEVDLYPYDELWNIQKGNLFLTGQLFLSLTSEKALRFNWINNDLRNEIHSIDIWNRFEFDTNPSYTLNLNEDSVVKVLPEVVKFWNNPKSLINVEQGELSISEELETEEYDPYKRLEDEEKKLSRLRNPEKIELQKRTIERLKVAIAETERSSTESEKVTQLDDEFQIDVFKMIELYTIQVARGKSNSLIISGDAGVGKCHGKGTKILMYDGAIRNVEDIEVGDLLMGNDSKPRKVLSLGRGKDIIYEIKSKGWDSFTVNSEHILVLRNRKKSSNKPFEISVKDFLQKSKTFQEQSQLIRTSVEFEKKEIDMDPYLMGIWLGDGSRTSPHGIETADVEIVSFLEEKANEYNLILKKHINKKSKSDGYYFSSGNFGKGLKLERNYFLNHLKKYNLYNCVEKFIPNDYLINSTEVRKKLLAGLIDSDGYQFHKSYSIATKWRQLGNQIVFLSRSLGFKSHISIKNIKGKEYYNVNISGDLSDLPIRLERKKSEKRNQIKNVLNSGFTISEIGHDDYYGFELDGNHLYLLGDFTITHNTQTVRDTLASLGMEKDTDYYFATGTATTAGLYELLFRNRSKLLIFDDCDAVFKEPESVNILKGALDTYETREISKLTKGNTFDSSGMEEEEIEDNFNTSGKFPNKFDFTGHIIFISNLPESKFDKALLSRSLHVDVHLNKVELLERMKNIMKRLAPDVEYDQKLEALDYLTYICNTYPTKFDLNIRTLIHSINLRAHNEELIRVGEQEVSVWKLLIKKYLVKSR